MRFSEPKTPCSLDTVKPPATSTTISTTGIHSLLRSVKNVRDQLRERRADDEALGMSRRRDCGASSRRSGLVPSGRASAAVRTPRSNTAPPRSPPRFSHFLANRSNMYCTRPCTRRYTDCSGRRRLVAKSPPIAEHCRSDDKRSSRVTLASLRKLTEMRTDPAASVRIWLYLSRLHGRGTR